MKKRLLSVSLISAALIAGVNAETFHLNKGWNLIGSSKKIELNNSEFAKNPDISVIWTYKDGKWSYFSSKKRLKGHNFTNAIGANQGAWVYSDSDLVINYNSNSASNGTSDDLTDEQKYALAYMWNEEKLAKDIYLALNDLYPHQTLYNIPTRSEVEHEAAVEALVQKYDINITNLKDYKINYSEEELRALAPGEYAVPEVQELYDNLYEKGSQSLQDALEVGCMVEVTDIDDLNRYIEIANGKEDLITTFEFLKRGSYNHYWAFDKALKDMGVSEGCCSLGAKYCKTEEEYPRSNGGGNGQGHGKGNGSHGRL